MSKQEKIKGTTEAWESGQLGVDEGFAKLADVDHASIDDALELQMISIRLQKSLIEDFKIIAQLNGIGYQPLIRQILKRFADCEKKRILREHASKLKQEALDAEKQEASNGDDNAQVA